MQSKLLYKFAESAASKAGEKLVDCLFSKKDKITIESLESNANILYAKAFDVDAQIMVAERSGKRERKKEVDIWLQQVKLIEDEFRSLRNGEPVQEFAYESRLERLHARVEELLKQSRHFGELVRDVYDVKGERLLVKELVGKKSKENLSKAVQFLLEDKVKSIGIHGMGGVGKTALAKHINNRLLDEPQVSVFWIKIYQGVRISMLQDEVAKAVGADITNENNEDIRASILNRVLSKRENPVLILDDVSDDIDLEKLGDPHSVEGCRLVITTRSEVFCHQLNCKEVIMVEKLKKDEAWNLFEHAHGPEINQASIKVQTIAMSMVKYFDGLPLGIIALAEAMKGETEAYVWQNALTELKECNPGLKYMERVLKVLQLSFDRLNQNQENGNVYSKLQHCFLYCSLFSKEDKLDTEELIRKFIVEEFLDKRASRKELLQQGRVLLKKLVDCCLLESVSHDQVKMHNLFRPMALKVSQGKIKVVSGQHPLQDGILSDKDWTIDIEKISLRNTNLREIPDGMSPNCPNMTTLLLDGNPLESIPHAFFLQIVDLRILDLSRTDIKGLPDSLSELESLKALFLRECHKLVSVPCLRKLKELRELDFTSTAVEEVPQGMEELTNLKFLSFFNARHLDMLPQGLLLNFPDLECLHLPYHIHVSGKEVAKLKRLEEFHGRVKDARNFFALIREGLAYSIEVRSGVPCYRLDQFKGYNQLILSRHEFNEDEGEEVPMLAHGIIQHLKLHACQGLRSCLVETLSQLTDPVSLESLQVHNCEAIEYLLRNDQLQGADEAVASTSTSPLHVVFSSLRHLKIFHCNKIKGFGLLPCELPNLEEITVAYCEEIEVIIQVNELEIKLPRLKCVFLDDLPRLESICNATMVCSSIEIISMWGCQKVKKLPMVFESSNQDLLPETLRGIWIKEGEMEWWDNLELGHPNYHRLLQPFIN